MGKRSKGIKNELAYFYKVIKNMDKKDSLKRSEIHKHEISIEDITYDEFSKDFNLDKQLFEKSLLGWIELIENEKLHMAVNNLSLDEKILLNYVFYEEKTQREISEIYNIAQQSIAKKVARLINKLKRFLSNK